MPDNPIRHDEIIQPGNPFTDTIKGLEKVIKLLKEAAKDYLKFAEKQNTATKAGRKNLQSVASATNQLSIKEKEAIKIKQQLEKVRAKAELQSTEAYRNLIKEREAVKRTDAALRKSVKTKELGIKSTNKWSKALGSFQFKFNALGNIAANVASAISRYFNRAIRDAIRVTKDFDKSMADVKAITGATGKEFKSLVNSAKQLGGSTKFTASQVGQLQKEYAKLGFTTEEILKAQGATLDLAAATGTDLARSAEVAGITIRQFGLDAKETRRITDVMARSFTTSALDMEKFAEAMKYVGPAAKASGLSVEQTTAYLGQLADAGISGSQAGTALRQIMLALSKESGTFAEKIAKATEGNLDLAGATEEVQKRAATALLVLKDGADTIDDFTESLEGAAGAAGEMADVQLDTLAGQATIVKSAWEGMILSMLYTEENLNGVKWALQGIIDILNAMAIRAETGMKFSQALGLTKAIDDSIEWAEHMVEVDENIDLITDGFKNFKDNWSGIGKDLWNTLFPKEDGDIVIKQLEDITKLLDNLWEEYIFTEEDPEPVVTRIIGTQEDADKSKQVIDDLNTYVQSEQTNQINKAKADTKRAEEQKAKDQKEAEEKKQATIRATFDLADNLSTTFTNIFASQKAKELSAVGDNAEKRAEIEKKYARKEQALAISQATVDGAAAIVKTWRNMGGFPTALPFVIAQAAATAAQIGVIASQKFAEGGSGLLDNKGGILSGKRHSQGGVNLGEIGEAERGEYFGIVNRSMTKKYGNDLPLIFDSLNNGAFHEVWGRLNIKEIAVNHSDPWTKRMYELMANTPVEYSHKGKIIRHYPNRTIISG